ncbi:hypothetical protein JZ751_026367 [Albula glossodonta]|uniref:Tectonic domain-containing protein n=1 Tax=Albula glossodonta TaxID=121402 RepID=A0A8T2PBS4_9TELE|nr:hypothetical protein JZ751_026367 [Albula glossodonta]
MNTLLLSRAFCFLMLILSDNRAVAQTTGSETSTTNPTKPSVTSDIFAESVTFITFPMDTQATTEFDNLVTDFLETVTPGVGSSTDGDTTTIYGTRDPDTTQTDATTDVNVITTEATTESNIMATDTTISVCTCDLTPGFCDIGCCCDTIDCGINDLGSVFSGCEAEERGNVDPTLITVNDTFFCVRNSEVQLNNQQILPEKSRFPKVEDSFSFSQQPPSPPSTTNRDFYRVDDAILTHFKSSSLLSVLRQPSPGVASSSCVDRNPARFLRSVTLSCSRLVTAQTCVEDPGLKASSYVNDISLLRAPVPQNVSIPNFTVEYIIEYTSGGELTRVTVNVSLIDINSNAVMLQEHTVQYLLATPAPTPGPSLAVGLHPETLVFGRFGEDIRPLTVQGTSQDGECSTLPHARSPILLTNNYVTGCSFSSPSKNCSELRSQLFWIIEGPGSPDLVAMTSGPQPDWSRVITQNCSDPPLVIAFVYDDSCESGCLVPLSLTVQLLWAQQGLLSLPQIHILGAKFIFQCQTVKCPIISPLAVTTEVKFSDISVYPEPPRGLPQPHWKFPFGFFSRGAIEQDAGPVANRYDFSRQAWATLSFLPVILSMIL